MTSARRVALVHGGAIENHLVKEYRRRNPSSRVTRLLRYHLSSSRVKQEACILCGETGPTWSAKYVKPNAACDWAAEHRLEHVLAFVREQPATVAALLGGATSDTAALVAQIERESA